MEAVKTEAAFCHVLPKVHARSDLLKIIRLMNTKGMNQQGAAEHIRSYWKWNVSWPSTPIHYPAKQGAVKTLLATDLNQEQIFGVLNLGHIFHHDLRSMRTSIAKEDRAPPLLNRVYMTRIFFPSLLSTFPTRMTVAFERQLLSKIQVRRYLMRMAFGTDGGDRCTVAF
jgi:hypothetical protein